MGGRSVREASGCEGAADACVLCGEAAAVPSPLSSPAPAGDGGRVCPVCGWRAGDSPDADLPRPRIEVVYYLRWDARVKIGTTADPRRRLAVIWHHELLAFEPGGRALERARHEQFAHLREGGEWFRADPELREHAAALASGIPPWHSYARWVADALRRNVS